MDKFSRSQVVIQVRKCPASLQAMKAMKAMKASRIGLSFFLDDF